MRALDVLVVGGGQAGLAAGYWLDRAGSDYLIVDGAQRVGDSWRGRWDSLTLFTPAAYSALPGLPLPGRPDRYPTKDEVADYLAGYAAHFRLQIRLASPITRLATGARGFVASGPTGALAARAVIVASGPFQAPALPALAAAVDGRITQLTPSSYRNPAAMPSGSVLIVGDGASGRQIALELAASHRVLLATGRPRRVSPERVLGRSIFWWLDRLGVLRAGPDSRLGRYLREADPFPGRHLALARLASRGVAIKPRVAGFDGLRASFADGSSEDIGSVIWATGYRDELGWLDVPGALDERGSPIQRAGRSPVGGLYFVGRSWQRNRASALIHGAGEDARLVVESALAHVSGTRPVTIAEPDASVPASAPLTRPSEG